MKPGRDQERHESHESSATSPVREFLAGVPVAVDPLRIERELAALWKPASEAEGGEGAVVRACLSNLVVHVSGADELGHVASLLEEISRHHPNRTLLLSVDPRGSAPRVEENAAGVEHGGRLRASVTALCHSPAPGVAPVCSEQIRLLASSDDADLLAGAVAPLLVPDLPVYLWWTGERLTAPRRHLGRLAEALVVDSRRCRDGIAALSAVRGLVEGCGAADVIDLSWRSLERWRQTVAEVFEEPALRAALSRLQCIELEVEVTTNNRKDGAEALRTPGTLLAGWALSRLGWRTEKGERTRTGWSAECRAPDGAATRVSLRARVAGEASRATDGSAAPGAPVALRLATEVAGDNGSGPSLSLTVDPSAPDSLEIAVETAASCGLPRHVPFPHAGDAKLLAGVLDGPRQTGVFREALAAACELVGVA